MITDVTHHGIHLLQRYVHAFGSTIVNAFDLDAWSRASTLETFAVRLILRAGTARVALMHIPADGPRTELAQLALDTPGTAATGLFRPAQMSGALLPVVLEHSPGANFDVVFVTDDEPSQPHARINYIFCTYNRAQYVQHNADVFREYRRRWRDHARSVHLTVVDNGSADATTPTCGVQPDEAVTVYTNHNTGGAGGFGRGIYESAYGALPGEGFSHVCLLDDDIHLHPEMFARNTAFVRYLKPGFHIGAPMYPTSSPESGPALSACFGHRFRGTIHPSDTAIGAGLQTTAIEDFVRMDRKPDTTGWWWDCIALSDVHRIGLPYPFFIKMDDVEYGLRLKEAGVELVIPYSFWVLHDDFEEKYSAAMQYFRFRNRWLLLAQFDRLEAEKLATEWTHLVRGFVATRRYEHAQLLLDGMEHFLAGPDSLLRNEKEILAGIFRVVKVEKNVPIPEIPAGSELVNGLYAPTSPRTQWLNKVTVNNHFLPLSESLVIDTTQRHAETDCRRGKTVTFWNGNKGVGYTVTRDSRKAAAQMMRLRRLARRLRASMPALAETYRARKRHLTSPSFWAEYGHFGAPLRLAPAESAAEAAMRHEVGRLQQAQQVETARRRASAVSVSDEDLVFLNAIRNRHAGQRCFVLGNGPSLKVEDLELLKNEVTFAANKIYLCFNETQWRPTYYSVEDLLVAQNCQAEIMALSGMTKIFPDHMLRFLPRRANHHYARWLPPADNRVQYREFSRDLTKGICWGSTITYSMLQMAVHMGFREIYLLGLDHSYVEPSTKQDGALVSEGEVNHFHPDYRKPGERWHMPVLDRLEASYTHARDYCDSIGVKVWNASRFSKLEVFPRADLDAVLGVSKPAAKPARKPATKRAPRKTPAK
ncbi:MAG: glycosyltransferase [Rhodobacter sp.]|nr:glycosyltransferase [Paracoccaceae bacterium]MCC0077386.1 glycosyltransferase [Rhodobacter sp.]